MRGCGQIDARGDRGGVERRSGEVDVKRLGRIEFGDRQRPDQIVEMARVALADRLEILDAIEHDARIQNSDNISGFLPRIDG